MMISVHSRKIALSFVIVLGLSIAMIMFDLSRMKTIQSNLDTITKDHNYKSSLMIKMRQGIYKRQVSLRNIMLMNGTFDRDEGKTEFDSYAQNIRMARDLFSSLPLNVKEKEILKKIVYWMNKAYEVQIKLIDLSIYEGDKRISTEEILKTFKIQEVVLDQVKDMIELQALETEDAVMDAESSYDAAKKSVYIIGGSAILFGIFVAVFIIRLTESQARDVKSGVLEIERANELLEHRVEKRTKELALVRDEALAYNKAKDIFLANMSHELRTPLNIIIGYSELVEEVAIENKVKNIIPDLKKIQQAALHQLTLINSILDISKIEEGKLEVHAIDFDVEQLLFEIVASAKPLMLKNNNDFKINCMHGIGMMYSDNMRIRQILLNLLSNAAKFTKNGKVSLDISKEQKGDEIKFEIKDSGVGISEAYIADVFKKFTQEDSSTTKKYGGSGLGLSISQQLCSLLNGSLIVESEEGKGTCFTLTLPIIYIE